MADGRTHLRYSKLYTVVTTAGLAAGYAYIPDNIKNIYTITSLSLIAGTIWAAYITPDQDLTTYTHVEYILRRRLKFIGDFINSIYASYAVFHDHRGSSHWFVWGTIFRILWLFTNTFSAILMIALILGIALLGTPLNYLIILSFLFGAITQDGVHLWLDTKFVKQFRSPKEVKKRKRLLLLSIIVVLLTIITYFYFFIR